MGATTDMVKRAAKSAATATVVSAAIDASMVPIRELLVKVGVPESTLEHPDLQKFMKVAAPAILHLMVSMGEDQIDSLLGEGKAEKILRGTSIAMEVSMTEVGFHLMDAHLMPILKQIMLGAGEKFIEIGNTRETPTALQGSWHAEAGHNRDNLKPST